MTTECAVCGRWGMVLVVPEWIEGAAYHPGWQCWTQPAVSPALPALYRRDPDTAIAVGRWRPCPACAHLRAYPERARAVAELVEALRDALVRADAAR